MAVDGERLLMKGAHLTFKEMRHAFDSRCKEKDTQKKVAAANWLSLYDYIIVYLCLMCKK